LLSGELSAIQDRFENADHSVVEEVIPGVSGNEVDELLQEATDGVQSFKRIILRES